MTWRFNLIGFIAAVVWPAAIAVAQTPDCNGNGVPDCVDNCPAVANADQADSDGNGVGDACDDATNSEPPADQATTGGCGCGSGIDGVMVMPMTFLGIGWMRRRTRRWR